MPPVYLIKLESLRYKDSTETARNSTALPVVYKSCTLEFAKLNTCLHSLYSLYYQFIINATKTAGRRWQPHTNALSPRWDVLTPLLIRVNWCLTLDKYLDT